MVTLALSFPHAFGENPATQRAPIGWT